MAAPAAAAVTGVIGRVAAARSALSPEVVQTLKQVSIAAAAAAGALALLTKTTRDHVKEVRKLTESARGAADAFRSVQSQQAMLASQTDMLSRGYADAMNRLRNEGSLLTNDQIAAAARVDEAQQRMGRAFSSLRATVVTALEPAFTTLANTVGTLTIVLTQSIKTVQESIIAFIGSLPPWISRVAMAGINVDEMAMRRALENQAIADRATQRRFSDIQDVSSGTRGARAGSAGEYAFFVRRQDQQDRLMLEELRSLNMTMQDFVRAVQEGRDPRTNEPQAVQGI